MSNNKDFSDYNKPKTDLNKLLPRENLKNAKVLEGLNHNLFNRFFTKEEVEEVVGIIGSTQNSTDPSLRQVKESNDYRQANQLQPVVYSRIGDIDWFMSFRDFIARLELLGVNVDRFNDWGNSLQFNWIPPIDLDKLINYQDYYWDSNVPSDPPQYITIKNLCNWVTGRRTQILRSIERGMPTYNIEGYDEPSNIVRVSGNRVSAIRVGESVVLTASGVNPIFAPVVSLNYVVGGDYTEVEFSTSDYNITTGINDNFTSLSRTEITVQSFNAANNTITVTSDVTNLFETNYVFSSENSTTSQPLTLWTVSSAEYDSIANTTTITVKENLEATFDWSRLSTMPIVRSVDAEYNVICDDSYSVSPFGSFDESDIGNIIWAKNILLSSSNTGSTSLGSTLFTDATLDFLDGTYELGDIINITGTGFDGEYPIENLVTSNIVDLQKTFFTQNNISYEVFRKRLLSDIEFETGPSTGLNKLWYDTTNNQLRQWNGSTWVVVVDNFSALVDINNNSHLIDLKQDNDWVDQNKWVHRSEINNFTGKSRAQLPIIEYFPLLKLSSHSFAQKAWRYRRNDNVSYARVQNGPSFFELIDTRIVSGGEVSFSDSTTLLFGERFGNLTNDLTEGVEIRLGDFGTNTGTNEVISSEFVQLAPGQRYRTRVTLKEPVIDPLDTPTGAYVAPLTTSQGDPWISADTLHWQFEGIEDIAASSYEPEKNPMLDEVVSSDTTGSLSTILGLYFQEFKYVAGSPSVLGANFVLDSSLHDLCLYEDFQEGDIRVYINGERQYGNFVEIAAPSPNNDYVGEILFNPDVEITDKDVVRIELGEYALEDIGKKDAQINTVSGIELFNLVDTRKIEQEKTERSQYPWFNIYDVFFNPLTIASTIFRYNDDPEGTYEPNIDQRVVYDKVARSYTFRQELLNETTGELYVYYDGHEYEDEFQSIWKRGLNNEQYVPVEENDFWEIPNQFYYNVKHENRSLIKLTEIFRHFDTIIKAQSAPGIASDTFNNIYHLDNSINFGLGGTIKEHNDGFDTLLSAMFVNNVDPIDLIQFANNRYDNGKITLAEILKDNIDTYFSTNGIANVAALTDFIKEEVQDSFEKNDKLDKWFGDSTTFDETTNTGVKNWIATVPFLGLAPKVKPYLIQDDVLGIIEIVHHDGHRSNVKLNQAAIESYIKSAQKAAPTATQTVSNTAAAFPSIIDGSPPSTGDLVIRTNTSDGTRRLYRYSNVNTWEHVDFSLIFAKVILNIETALYNILSDDALPANFISKYNFNVTKNDSEYPKIIQQQFSNYVSTQKIQGAFLNNSYSQNNPFTWNYGFTTIKTDPRTGGNNTQVFGYWKALYESIFDTPYPHLEPWKLQGYDVKPDYWDTQYRDTGGVRRWTTTMWNNILNGVIPVGEPAPDGGVGTGTPNQITNVFNYIPVNIDSTNTLDGYTPDSLLPPYWNSSNSSNPAVRSVHDSFKNEFIVTPSAGFDFGQKGPVEWDWSVSSQRLYDELIAAFRLQPLKFMNQTFGSDLTNVACLQVDKRTRKVASHENTVFHGEIINTNNIFKVNGLNQWYIHYNRYNGFDGISSEFREMWSEWIAPLTYEAGGFLNTQNINIASDNFEITTEDYDVIFKKSIGIRDIWLDPLEARLLSTPSKFSPEFESGVGWTVELTNNSPVSRPIKAFGVQNYPVRVVPGSDTFRTFSFDIEAAEIEESFGFDVVQYSETAAPTVETSLANDNTTYFASVQFNGVTTVNLEVVGKNAQTFGSLVNVLNDQLGNNGSAFLEDGNLIIASSKIGGSTFAVITDSGLFSSVSSNFQGTTGNQFNTIKFNNVFYVKDDASQYFPAASTFEVKNSTVFNGQYTVIIAKYDTDNKLTRIEVEENVPISNSTIDGVIEPSTAVDLPAEWQTGVGLNWASNGTVPNPFNSTDLFFIIRVNDREFKLAKTREAAQKGTALIPNSDGTNQNYVGRIKNTFTAFSARQVESYWKQHVVDKRIIKDLPTPITITGIQNMVDFINGYSAYLESLGFVYTDDDGTNRDPSTGRQNDWQLETEKLIEFLFTSKRTQQTEREEYVITPNSATNTFKSTETITWNTGTRITFNSTNGVLPVEFESPIADTVGYYVIQAATPGVLQLAASFADAQNGIALKFSDDGSGILSIRLSPKIKRFPSIELNPHKNTIFVNHDTGILSNVFQGTNLDTLTNQRIYDQNGNNIEIEDVLTYRKDKRSQIALTENRKERNQNNLNRAKYISGMHLFFDGYEHVIQFPNYSVIDCLIYDPFLGINTPRFSVQFDRQSEFTLRPNMGGNVVIDDSQVDNIEQSIESLRYAYSTTRSKEGDVITDAVRKSLGYQGPFDYADNLGITDKSQFLFYRGLIQKKGTNFAANAFTNQTAYKELDVDEFWAYRIDCFGDSKQKVYPELKLFSRDVRKELRLEFVEPLGSVSNSSFEKVEIDNEERWFEQPDQVEKLSPRDRFYINPRVQERIENVVNDGNYFVFDGNEYLLLEKPADAAFVTYQVSTTEYQQLVEGTNYEFITNTLIRFIDTGTGLVPSNEIINVSTLAYNYDAQNPAKIINTDAGTVETEVPIWNPRRQQYYHLASYAVDYRVNEDPALYNNPIETGASPANNVWDKRFKDNVWFDIKSEGYLPFDDKNIESDLETRIKSWGKLADWGEIKVFQWTESDVPPSEYDELAQQQADSGTLSINERKTGTTRKVVYRNDGTVSSPNWVEERDKHADFFAQLVDSTSTVTLPSGIFKSYTDAGLSLGESVDVYIDGKFEETTSFAANIDFDTYASNVVTGTGITQGTTIHVVQRATAPTNQQIEDGDYKLDTPYSTVNRIDPITGEEKLTYYFWVEDKLSTIPIKGGPTGATTLTTVKNGFLNIPTPYMIPNFITDISATSYADLFSTNSPKKEDTVSYEFPFVYKQLIIRGLVDSIRADDSYILRFVRDFTLRDNLENNDPDISELQLKNLHWIWKLFREKQFAKVDRVLWNAITESILGFEYDGSPISNVTPTPTPSVTPSVTPSPSEIVGSPTPSPTASITPSITPSPFPTQTPPSTPPLTPDATPAPSITPSNTEAISPTPSPEPSVTPSNTPVASPTPSPVSEVVVTDLNGGVYTGDFSDRVNTIDPNPASTGIQFTRTGVNPENAIIIRGIERYKWLDPVGFPSSPYEIRVIENSGSFTSGSAINTWIDLGNNNPAWSVTQNNPGVNGVDGTVQIREKGSGTIVLDRNFSFIVSVQSSSRGGGGLTP